MLMTILTGMARCLPTPYDHIMIMYGVDTTNDKNNITFPLIGSLLLRMRFQEKKKEGVVDQFSGTALEVMSRSISTSIMSFLSLHC